MFIHYGAGTFSPSVFKPIKNSSFCKPYGGLWGSPADSRYGWKQWCEREGYRIKPNKSFTFTVKGNVTVINSLEDLLCLPAVDKYLDFEECLAKGIDAILLTYEGQMATCYSDPINLLEWDCESIIVLNASSVIV